MWGRNKERTHALNASGSETDGLLRGKHVNNTPRGNTTTAFVKTELEPRIQ